MMFHSDKRLFALGGGAIVVFSIGVGLFFGFIIGPTLQNARAGVDQFEDEQEI
jgi:hypothetical protein